MTHVEQRTWEMHVPIRTCQIHVPYSRDHAILNDVIRSKRKCFVVYRPKYSISKCWAGQMLTRFVNVYHGKNWWHSCVNTVSWTDFVDRCDGPNPCFGVCVLRLHISGQAKECTDDSSSKNFVKPSLRTSKNLRCLGTRRARDGKFTVIYGWR